jgi:hypothetical protein
MWGDQAITCWGREFWRIHFDRPRSRRRSARRCRNGGRRRPWASASVTYHGLDLGHLDRDLDHRQQLAAVAVGGHDDELGGRLVIVAPVASAARAATSADRPRRAGAAATRCNVRAAGPPGRPRALGRGAHQRQHAALDRGQPASCWVRVNQGWISSRNTAVRCPFAPRRWAPALRHRAGYGGHRRGATAHEHVLAVLADQAGDRGLAGPGRTPEDHRRESSGARRRRSVPSGPTTSR